MPKVRRKRPAPPRLHSLRWERAVSYKDTCGQEGAAWYTHCGRFRVTDAGPLDAPFNLEIAGPGNTWRAAITEVGAGDFKTVRAAQRAARAITLISKLIEKGK